LRNFEISKLRAKRHRAACCMRYDSRRERPTSTREREWGVGYKYGGGVGATIFVLGVLDVIQSAEFWIGRNEEPNGVPR
jgi:hypothetical protein